MIIIKILQKYNFMMRRDEGKTLSAMHIFEILMRRATSVFLHHYKNETSYLYNFIHSHTQHNRKFNY